MDVIYRPISKIACFLVSGPLIIEIRMYRIPILIIAEVKAISLNIIVIGLSNPTMPSTNVELAIMLPRTLPMAISL